MNSSSNASKLKKKTTNDRNRLELRDVPGKGRGVFARSPFPKGVEVLEFFGERVDRDDLDDLMHALQVDARTFLTASGDIDDYVNHSCAPNTGIRDDAAGRVTLFALNDIEVGDEITFDYATTQANGFSTMECGCGAKGCRKTIADWKDIPAARRTHYLAVGAVLSYLDPRRKGEGLS